ncbi:MAG: hypothetical protein D3917_14760 [Candidatus Electrothrix sp. AX5]|nr:hypothetical protein [Candidatus Electrothrix sp. AX5]
MIIIRNQCHSSLDGEKGEPARSFVSHSFVFTTNEDGTLKHTYSWGNAKNENGDYTWFIDQDIDINAAETALSKDQDKYVKKIGNERLDGYIHDTFLEFEDDLTRQHGNYIIKNNCKTEADILEKTAKGKLQQEISIQKFKTYLETGEITNPWENAK